MYNKKSGKFKSVAPKHKVAKNPYNSTITEPKYVWIPFFLHIPRAHEQGQICTRWFIRKTCLGKMFLRSFHRIFCRGNETIRRYFCKRDFDAVNLQPALEQGCRKQTTGARNYFTEWICYTFLMSKCRGDRDLGLCTTPSVQAQPTFRKGGSSRLNPNLENNTMVRILGQFWAVWKRRVEPTHPEFFEKNTWVEPAQLEFLKKIWVEPAQPILKKNGLSLLNPNSFQKIGLHRLNSNFCMFLISKCMWRKVRSRSVHDFGICKENAAAQCRLPMNLAAERV